MRARSLILCMPALCRGIRAVTGPACWVPNPRPVTLPGKPLPESFPQDFSNEIHKIRQKPQILVIMRPTGEEMALDIARHLRGWGRLSALGLCGAAVTLLVSTAPAPASGLGTASSSVSLRNWPEADAMGRRIPRDRPLIIYVSPGCLSCSADASLLRSEVPEHRRLVFIGADDPVDVGLSEADAPSDLYYIEDRDRLVLSRAAYANAPFAVEMVPDGRIQPVRLRAGRTWAEVLRG